MLLIAAFLADSAGRDSRTLGLAFLARIEGALEVKETYNDATRF